nr:probable receptor-like protein kinase At4g10390 [Ipomoea batatas]
MKIDGESLPPSISVSKNEAHADIETHAQNETQTNSQTQADNEENNEIHVNNDEDDKINGQIDGAIKIMIVFKGFTYVVFVTTALYSPPLLLSNIIRPPSIQFDASGPRLAAKLQALQFRCSAGSFQGIQHHMIFILDFSDPCVVRYICLGLTRFYSYGVILVELIRRLEALSSDTNVRLIYKVGPVLKDVSKPGGGLNREDDALRLNL